MDQIASQLLVQFFSPVTALFTICIGGVVFLIRRVVQALAPRVIPAIWWNQVFLPCLPPIIGLLAAWLIASYPYPEVFAKATASRVFYGLVCGFFSSKIYRIGWVIVKKQLTAQGIDPKDLESVRPPNPPPFP